MFNKKLKKRIAQLESELSMAYMDIDWCEREKRAMWFDYIETGFLKDKPSAYDVKIKEGLNPRFLYTTPPRGLLGFQKIKKIKK